MFMEPYVRKYTGEGHSACHYCGKMLDKERAIESTPSGQRYFCFAEKHQTAESCFLRWKRKGFI